MKVILLTYANSQHSFLEKLEEEIKTIDNQLIHFINDGIATSKKEAVSNVKGLEDLIERYKINLSLLLFSGHASQQGIQLEDGNEAYGIGLAKKLSLNECPNLKLVFLNGCSTKGMVEQLLENGVPVVIYTYSPVGDEMASIFSIAFFKALSGETGLTEGKNIESALGMAIAAIDVRTNKKIKVEERDIMIPKKDLDNIEINKNHWGCAYSDANVFKQWTIASKHGESIRLENFENLVNTEKNEPDYKRLEMLRKFLFDLEENKKFVKEEKQIIDIESLCLHIENEIKNIKLSYDLKREELITTNKKIHYKFIKPIAFGRFSDIYLAIRSEDGAKGTEVAFKVLKSDSQTIKDKIFFSKDFDPNYNLVNTISGSFDTNFEYYVTEYIDKRNLRDFIIDSKAAHFKEELKEFQDIKIIIEKISIALAYLHKKEFAHLDVRPSNIVIKENGKKIENVVLIDFDDYVSAQDTKFEFVFKSNPYLDPQIHKDSQNTTFIYEHCVQADIYALTLVLLFCIKKEDFMNQNKVKQLREPNGLKKYIDSSNDITEQVKLFLKQATGIEDNVPRFNNIVEFKDEFDRIERIRPKKQKLFFKFLEKHAFPIILAVLLLFIVTLSWNYINMDNQNDKFKRLQDWHLQTDDIKEQIKYAFEKKPFIQEVENIVTEIQKYSKGSDNDVNFYYLISNDSTKNIVNSYNSKYNYNGIEGDFRTVYNPELASIAVTHRSKNIFNVKNFGKNYNNIINGLSKYLIERSIEYLKKNGEDKNNFLNGWLIQEKDDEHLITLIYLGYSGKDGNSFMLRYPAYFDSTAKPISGKKDLYRLTERDWWKQAISDSTKQYWLTHPYVDTRKNMPQPRTFWYRIPTTIRTDTLVLGIDFIFRPIKS